MSPHVSFLTITRIEFFRTPFNGTFVRTFVRVSSFVNLRETKIEKNEIERNRSSNEDFILHLCYAMWAITLADAITIKVSICLEEAESASLDRETIGYWYHIVMGTYLKIHCIHLV